MSALFKVCAAFLAHMLANSLSESNFRTCPPIPRMWSIWMFTIPSLRAKECLPKEKDALNILFVATPLLNVLLPFVWKSFAFIFTADVAVLLGVYYWKGVFMEVGGISFSCVSFSTALLPVCTRKFCSRQGSLVCTCALGHYSRCS